MTAQDYSGPDRRRGGPDRRALDEVTRILVVDDHALFRMGIANILGREPDFEIVAEAEDSRGAIDRALEMGDERGHQGFPSTLTCKHDSPLPSR